MKYTCLFLPILFLLSACKPKADQNDYSNLDKNVFLVEIVISAGKTNNRSFLPYPGNFAKLKNAGAAKVLILSEAIQTGETLPVNPLGVLVVKDQSSIQNIIIASPIDSTKQLTKSTNFQEFIVQNVGEKQIIQDWFLYHKGLGKVSLVGWKDEKYALQLAKTVSNK